MNDYMYDYMKGVTDSVWEFASQYGRVVAYQRLKTVAKLKPPALKMVAVAHERFVGILEKRSLTRAVS